MKVGSSAESVQLIVWVKSVIPALQKETHMWFTWNTEYTLFSRAARKLLISVSVSDVIECPIFALQ